VKTADTIFEIIEYLQESDGATRSEVAENFDMSESTAHSHLTTLESLHYLVRDEGNYKLGYKFMNHGNYVQNRYQAIKFGISAIQRLTEETSELVWMLVEEHGRSIPVEKAMGKNAVQFTSEIGTALPMHTSAGGKAMLAHLDEDYAQEIIDQSGLEKSTKNTITDPNVLENEFEKIREQGFAVSDGESVPGARAVAAPIVVNDKVFGAISVPGPKNRLQGEFFEETLPELLLSATNEIELNLRDVL
jgi:DNA-binding IclR family transcriptional regulator